MTARILDRGYRRYNGPRTGVRGAVRTVWLHTLQRTLGVRRSVWAKVWPILMVAISYVPAIVFIGIVAFVPARDLNTTTAQTGIILPTYGEYFGFIVSALVLFVAFVGPEVLCPDRRTGMLGMYLASPLTRDSYLLGKALATATVLLSVTVGPPLLMLIAFVIQGNGPDGPVGVVVALLRILASGACITLIYTAFSMGVSSLTDRKSFATVGLILFFFMSNILYSVLVQVMGVSENAIILNIFFLPLQLVANIHGEAGHYPGSSAAVVALGAALWTLVWAIVCRTRYQHLQVTK